MDRRYHAAGGRRRLGRHNAGDQGHEPRERIERKILLYQLIISAPILALGAHLSGEHVLAPPSALAVGSLLYQTVWVVALTYIAWFALIQRYSASRLSVFTFLTPLFGIAAGHLMLGEALTAVFAAAAALVVLGLVLVNRPR